MAPLSAQFPAPTHVLEDTNFRSPYAHYVEIAGELGFEKVGEFAFVDYDSLVHGRFAAPPAEFEPRLVVFATRDGLLLTIATDTVLVNRPYLHAKITNPFDTEWLNNRAVPEELDFFGGEYYIADIRNCGLRKATRFFQEGLKKDPYWDTPQALEVFANDNKAVNGELPRPVTPILTDAEHGYEEAIYAVIHTERFQVVHENIRKMMGFDPVPMAQPAPAA